MHLPEATLDDLLAEISRRGYRFVFAALGDDGEAGHPDLMRTRLVHADAVSTEQAVWILDAAAETLWRKVESGDAWTPDL